MLQGTQSKNVRDSVFRGHQVGGLAAPAMKGSIEGAIVGEQTCLAIIPTLFCGISDSGRREMSEMGQVYSGESGHGKSAAACSVMRRANPPRGSRAVPRGMNFLLPGLPISVVLFGDEAELEHL
jgi:hypothetical protein